MANRTRNIVLRVPVTAEERAMIERKMQQMGTGCFSVYARKMLIDGYVIRLDYSDVKAMTAELQKIGTNINQIAKRVNATGTLYAQDIEDIKGGDGGDMAITKIHPIKSTLKKAIDYIVDPAKTDDKLLVSSFGCAVETADLEFEKTRLLAMQKGNNLAHQLIQAFEPGEVSYAQAHEIGRQLADEILGGKYEYVIATHINKEHCHIVGLFKLSREQGYTLKLIPGTPEENAPVFDFENERILRPAA